MEAGLQEIVDALSVRLARPVLVDDVDLRPLAYSIQFGDLDAVRTESILGRTAPDAARDSLFGHGIRSRAGADPHPRSPRDRDGGADLHPDPARRAAARLPVADRGPRRSTTTSCALARAAATEAATVLQSEADTQLDRRRREQELLSALLSPDTRASAAAAAVLEADHYVPPRPLIVIVGSGAARPGRDRPLPRPDPGQARAVRGDRRARDVHRGRAGDDARRASSPRRSAASSPRAPRRTSARATRCRSSARPAPRTAARWRRCAWPSTATRTLARWDDLRAYRLLTALPPTAFDDVPVGLRKLLEGGHEQLVLTLETYLDHAGDVKSTAAELWLHRTCLYYRLRRIEEVAGVDLNRGEDRLLCHVALRLSRLQRGSGLDLAAGRDVDHLARAHELHARAALRLAEAGLVARRSRASPPT